MYCACTIHVLCISHSITQVLGLCLCILHLMENHVLEPVLNNISGWLTFSVGRLVGGMYCEISVIITVIVTICMCAYFLDLSALFRRCPGVCWFSSWPWFSHWTHDKIISTQAVWSGDTCNKKFMYVDCNPQIIIRQFTLVPRCPNYLMNRSQI